MEFMYLKRLFMFCIILRALLVEKFRDRFPVVSLGIFSVAPEGTMCPGVDSASENEYHGLLLG
jgi:hypothetical protein